MKNVKKAIALVLVLVLAMSIGVVGTLAYLQDSESVTNTFTIGKVDITLAETKGTEVSGGRSFQMIPGQDIEKDPKVTVLKDSEACWLFVKVEETNVTDYLTYSVDSTIWTELTGYTGVYYKEITNKVTAENGESYNVLTNNKVTVKDTVTNAMMDTAAQTAPTLKFTAYAIQKAGFENATKAWGELTATTSEDAGSTT